MFCRLGNQNLYYYNVLFDYKFLSEYSDVLNEAYLNIDFSNGITSNIRIGSLSIYKYDSASTNDISHIVLTTLKPILKERDSDESKLCGIELGLRSTNNMDNITVNNIELLDANVSNLGNFKEVEKDSINNINDAYNNYPNVINNDSEVDLKANNLTTIVTPIIYNESIQSKYKK